MARVAQGVSVAPINAPRELEKHRRVQRCARMSEVPADASFGEYPRAARSVGHVSSRVSPVVDSLRCWRRRHPSVDPLAVGRRADRHNRALAARHTQIVLLLGDESNDRRPGPVELDSKVVLSRSYWRGAAPPSATSHRGAGRVDCSPQ
jgi:hypothetical protein